MADTDVVDPEVARRSVTAEETKVARQNYLWLGNFMVQAPLISLEMDLPAVGTRARDLQLFSTLQHEDKWANAVAIAATKCASLEYDINGDVELRRNRSYDILAHVDGMQGWSTFIAKHMQDFLCTDNGAFVEIVRASKSPGSRILGLLHLDSARCYRTGDPNMPVIYRDRLGGVHPLRAHQVIAIADMPNPRVTYNGTGQCAAARVYKTLWRMAAIEQYIAEKVAGRRPQAVYLLTGGMSQKQINQIFESSSAEAEKRGMLNFQGAAVAALPTSETGEANLITIPFSGLPDEFDLEAERSNARLEYANAIGLDIQDLQPGAIGGSLGSSTQSQVLNEKSKGKGLSYWRKAFTEQLNLKVLPSATTFLFVEKDYRDEKAQAEAAASRIGNITSMITAGMIAAPTGTKIAIDNGDLPPDAAPSSATGAEDPNVLNSGEKPDDGEGDDTSAQADVVDEDVVAESDKEIQKTADIGDTFASAFKAYRARLLQVRPSLNRTHPQGRDALAREATKELRGYLRTLANKAREYCPEASGELRDSIRTEVKNANTVGVEGYLYAGNKARPELVVRSNLFGRRGFGPKDPDGVLAFEGADGETVFTDHVDASDPNNWLKRAWDDTATERKAMLRRVGGAKVNMIDVGDVPLSNAPHIDGYDARSGETVPNTPRNRRRGGQAA